MFVHRWDFDPDQGIRYERPKSQWYTFQRVTVNGRTHLQQISPEEQALARSMLQLAQALAREPAQPLPGPVDDSASVPQPRDTLAEAIKMQRERGMR